MKTKLILVLLLAAFSQAGFAQSFGNTVSKAKANASIKWLKQKHDFGEIKKDEPVTVEFKFKNTGLNPIIITKVESTCGCTVPDYPKKPTMGGQTAAISAIFDAKSLGTFYKTVKVFTNASAKPFELRLQGVVVK